MLENYITQLRRPKSVSTEREAIASAAAHEYKETKYSEFPERERVAYNASTGLIGYADFKDAIVSNIWEIFIVVYD